MAGLRARGPSRTGGPRARACVHDPVAPGALWLPIIQGYKTSRDVQAFKHSPGGLRGLGGFAAGAELIKPFAGSDHVLFARSDCDAAGGVACGADHRRHRRVVEL